MHIHTHSSLYVHNHTCSLKLIKFCVSFSGTTTVQVPDKITATKGQCQVGAVTSGERETLVTVAFAANAQGNFVPPYFVFPRKKFQDHFIRDGPVGCTGSANGSGWMQEADFLTFLKHFAKHTRVTQESKLRLICHTCLL